VERQGKRTSGNNSYYELNLLSKSYCRDFAEIAYLDRIR